jgi:hypothetical protein
MVALASNPPPTTNREEMEAVSNGDGPLGGERLVEYNVFLTDAFSAFGLAPSQSSPGAQDQLDNLTDDSYRRSLHLLNSVAGTSAQQIDRLRENSLARQIQDKADRPATIRLIKRRNSAELAAAKAAAPTEPLVPWINLIPPNTKFFLEQVQENREEKVQVIDTFGEWIAFFFGRKPEVYSYGGTLLNATNHDWKNEFQENYDNFLRGSKAVQNQATIMLQYDDVLVEGYMLNCSISMTGAMDKSVPFQFNMLVINRSPMNPRAIIGLRAGTTGTSDAEASLFNDMQQALDLTQDGKIDDTETFLLMREYFSGNYVPGAGTVTSRPGTGTIEAPVSTPPGTVGGLTGSATSPPPPTVSTPFTAGTSTALQQTNDPKLAQTLADLE